MMKVGGKTGKVLFESVSVGQLWTRKLLFLECAGGSLTEEDLSSGGRDLFCFHLLG